MAVCDRCGAEIPRDAQFCPSCGAPVTAERPAEERKLATVLFADLVGSTALADSEDPERTRALLDRFYDAMAEEIERAGGTVEKFAGDAVMAAFGAPTALEDHAERALHAALAMQRRLAELFDGELALRIGVNTGEVVVGRLAQEARSSAATRSTSPLGSSRLPSPARSSSASGQSRRRAARSSSTSRRRSRRRGSRKASSRRRLVRALSLMRPRGVGGLARAFVGREPELERLRHALPRAVEQRRPQLVTIVGDAGVGKTRLVARALERLPSRDPEPLRRTGRCLSYGTGTAYWPLGEVLQEHLGLLESDAPEVALERLGGREILGLTLGLDVAGDLHPLAARDRFQDAWVEFLTERRRRAARGSADRGRALGGGPAARPARVRARRSVEGPLLLIATARPELLERRPGWGARARRRAARARAALRRRTRTGCSTRCSPAACRASCASSSSSAPRAIRSSSRSCSAMLIDRGCSSRENGGWTPAASFRATSRCRTRFTPFSPRGSTCSGAAEKSALQAAAVIGRVFWTGPVYELVDGEPDLRAARGARLRPPPGGLVASPASAST